MSPADPKPGDGIAGTSFHIEWHEELDSTNTRAMSLAGQEGIVLPLLIGATRQTAGRGRGQNVWWSADGALLFSLLFNPLDSGVPFPHWPQLALTTGLAVADTLEQFVPPALVQLKWPNDVYVGGRKICGILAEVPPGRANRLVIGIGLNVANSFAAAPADVQASATSLKDQLGDRCPNLCAVLTVLISRWEFWLKQLAAGEIDFPTIWRPKCYLTGHRVTITVGDASQTGTCLGLDPDGVLLLETPHGVQRILAGTVRRV